MAKAMTQPLTGGTILPHNYEIGRIQRFTPEQQKIHKYMHDLVGPSGFLSKIAGGDESFFQEMEAPALRQHSAISGGAASRFGNLGMGSAKSGAFSMPGSSFKDFAAALKANRTQQRMDAINSLMSGSNAYLSHKPTETLLVPENDPFTKYSKIGPTVFGAGGGALQGGAMGGWPGAIIGGLYGAYQGYSSAK